MPPEHLVRVEWWDHAGTAMGWEPVKQMVLEELDRCVSVGKVIASYPDRIILASSWVTGRVPNKDVSHVAIIARRCVISIRRLVERSKPVPLKRGNKARSKKGVSSNIRTMNREGMPQKQAVAVAMKLAGKSRKKKKK